MKKLKLFLCLMAATVGLSTAQLQAKAATEKTGIEGITTTQNPEKPATVSQEKEATAQGESLIGSKVEDVQATIQDAKTSAFDVGIYPNSTVVFNEPGLLHVCTNSKSAVVYLVNASNTPIAEAYANSTGGYKVTFAVAKGTYKLAMKVIDYYDYGVQYTTIRKEIPTFTPSKNMTVTRSDAFSGKASYFVKIKAKKTGVLIVKPISGATGFLLHNGSKKALSNDEIYYTSSTAAFGIKKGATYYLKVTGYNQLKYSLKFSSINEKSGSKKSKAGKLSKKNKWSYGTLLAGSNQADWYKIKLTKKGKLTLVIKPQTNAGLKATVYGPNGKKWGSDIKLSNYYNGEECPFALYTSTWLSKNYKVKAGTYYVKITRDNKKSSGSYAIKWNSKTYK